MWFLELNHIPYEFRVVRIMKGQHLTPDYALINPMRKVPVIVDGEHTIFESHSILRYLAQRFNTPDHWYPRSDLLKRTRVDQYLDWHHLGLRKAVVGLVFARVMGKQGSRHTEPKAVIRTAKEVNKALDIMDTIWLKDGKLFLTGNEISIADLSSACEITQLKMMKFDLGSRPNLRAWMKRMEEWEAYDKVHKLFDLVVRMQQPEDFEKASL
jgi:glutathione S-transferase